MGAWYCNREKCLGCENYTGSCLYDIELEEKEDGVLPGTYTKAKHCPFFCRPEDNDRYEDY